MTRRAIAIKKCLLISVLVQALTSNGAAAEPVRASPWPPVDKQTYDLIQKSRSLLDQNHPGEATKVLEQAVALAPNHPVTHFKLGLLSQRLGNLQRAVSEYQTVLTIQPDSPAAIANLATCYQLLGDPQRAIQYFEKFLQTKPDPEDRKRVIEKMHALKNALGKTGCGDPQATDYLEAMPNIARWPRQKLPLRVYIDPGVGVTGLRPNFSGILEQSLKDWVEASNRRLGYVLVKDRSKADMICTWTNNPYDLGETATGAEQGTAAVTKVSDLRSPGLPWIERAEVRLLIIDRRTGKVLNDEALKKICLHELGHALGLSGHSSNNHDIMFFSESPTVKPELTSRDKATILRLYGDYRPMAEPH